MTAGGASAPGKALLCGEYAVLEGAPAVVTAVDRRALASWGAEAAALPPEVLATLERANRQVGPFDQPLIIDVDPLRQGGTKLGLGSSAAAAVAAAGAVFNRGGLDIGDDQTRAALFSCAFEGHAAVAPAGSGVDVAASTYGGFLRCVRVDGRLAIDRIEVTPTVEIRFVWTGHAARTSDLLAVVHKLRDRDPDTYRRRMAALAETAERFADAFEDERPGPIIDEAEAYAHAMEALGHDSGAPIVEDRLRMTAEVARAHGGSAKPCGAGGGDVAVAFFAAAEQASRFEGACREAGLTPLDLTLGAPGVTPC
ncbi:MAG: hypothetical protein AAF500_10800 [Myxococcota bacterium]